MKPFTAALSGFVCVACLIAQTPPAKPTAAFDKVVLSVGDEKITAGQLEQLIDALPEQVRATARGPNKRAFIEQLIRVKLMAQEARRRKLEQQSAVQIQVSLQTDNLLANALFQQLSVDSKLDDASVRKYYDEHKSDYEQARARHILVRMKGSPSPQPPSRKELTDEEALAKAKDLRQKLVAGADFATLAKAESDDTGSGANGGDLGTFSHGKMVPAFEQAAFSLPVGEISEPVKTQFGYHLIKVEQRDAKTFDELRPEIEKRMKPDQARQAVEDLRKNAAVTIDESYFAAPPAPPTLAPVGK